MKKTILLTCSLIVFLTAGCGPSSEELAVTMAAQTDEAATQTQAAMPTDTPTAIPLIYRWVSIPAGEFLMGSEEGRSNESPVHAVYVDAFEIGEYEVTNHQYAQCVLSGICGKPAEFGNLKYSTEEYALNPVTGVNLNDAESFCDYAGGRLPTEPEWEYAARGGWENQPYVWGDDEPDCERANINGDGECIRGTSPVGDYAPNGYGLYDMAGNVWEWTADWYAESYYANSPASNPTGPESVSTVDTKVSRGGSWKSLDVYMPVSYRHDWFYPDYWSDSLGFRCVRSP